MTVPYEHWLASEIERDTLAYMTGWREPEYAELHQEEQDRQDRLEDRGGGLMTPRREPAVAPPRALPVHHTQAPPLPSPPDAAGGPGSTSQGA